jgi:periplasmic divalent cation tolerance protein
MANECGLEKSNPAPNNGSMQSARKFALVLVTAPNLKTARTLAAAALQARLIACANLVPRIESHYQWKGKIESGTEVLMILKTTRTRLAALEKLILAKHPYTTPEFVVLSLNSGTKRYLDWLQMSC